MANHLKYFYGSAPVELKGLRAPWFVQRVITLRVRKLLTMIRGKRDTYEKSFNVLYMLSVGLDEGKDKGTQTQNY